MSRYTVKYERDPDGWWVASAVGLKGCHTQGRSIDEARRHIREAISAYLDLSTAEEAAVELRDDVKLPADVKRKLAALKRALAREQKASDAARAAARLATLALTERLHLSRRDAAALTGYSFQRIQQIVAEHA